MVKRLFMVTVIILLLFPGLICAESNGLDVSAIVYTDGTNTITSITPGGIVTAQVKVSANAKGENTFFSVVMFKENKMMDLAVDAKEIQQGENLFEVSLTMPEDISNCSLNATLWNDFKDMKPLCSAGLFPSSDNSLKSISIDGVSLENFSKDVYEYEYEVSGYRGQSPKVEAVSMDGGAKVKIATTQAFPGKSIITVTAADGNISTYTINYKSSSDTTAMVRNLRYLGPISSDDGSESYNDLSIIGQNLQNGDLVYRDTKDISFQNLSKRLKGASYINIGSNYQSGVSWLSDKWSGQDMNWFSFDIKRSAKIMVICEEELSKFAADSSGWKREYGNYYNRYCLKDGQYNDAKYMYSKKINVAEGDTFTVNIPNAGQGVAPYLILISYEYSEVQGEVYMPEEDEFITNLKYLGPTTDGTTTFDGKPVLMDDLQNGKTIYTNYSSVLFSKITEDMAGLPYIKIPNPISGLNPSFVKTAWSGGTTIDWVSFDLSKSALVKVFTQGEMNSLAQEKYGFKSNLAPATPGYYFQRYNNITNEYDSMNYMYTKEVSVPEGETATVTLPNTPGLACWGYSICIDFGNAQ